VDAPRWGLPACHPPMCYCPMWDTECHVCRSSYREGRSRTRTAEVLPESTLKPCKSFQEWNEKYFTMMMWLDLMKLRTVNPSTLVSRVNWDQYLPWGPFELEPAPPIPPIWVPSGIYHIQHNVLIVSPFSPINKTIETD